MDFLRTRLAEIGVTPAAFARALGLPKARAYEMQKGTRKLQPDEIGPAARILQWTEAELVARLEGRPTAASRSQSGSHENDIKGRRPLREGDTALPPLVVFRTTPDKRGRQEGFMLSTQPAGEVERPDFLRYSEKAFSAKVLDDKNTPAYRRRDHVLVDPDSPIIEDEDCLFTGDPAAPGGGFSVIACLVSSTGTLWKVRQYAGKGDFDLPKTDFPNAWPIVGRYNRR